jgi:hypothetical protein
MLGIEKNVPSSHNGEKIQDITCVDQESAQNMGKVETLDSTSDISLSFDAHDELILGESTVHKNCTMEETIGTIVTTVKTEIEESTTKRYSISFATKHDIAQNGDLRLDPYQIRIFKRWKALLKNKGEGLLSYICIPSLQSYNSSIAIAVGVQVREPTILLHATMECRIWMIA